MATTTDTAMSVGDLRLLIPDFERSLRAGNKAAKTAKIYGEAARGIDFLVQGMLSAYDWVAEIQKGDHYGAWARTANQEQRHTMIEDDDYIVGVTDGRIASPRTLCEPGAPLAGPARPHRHSGDRTVTCDHSKMGDRRPIHTGLRCPVGLTDLAGEHSHPQVVLLFWRQEALRYARRGHWTGPPVARPATFSDEV
ncbi:MAG: hypothetical protein M3137_06285 [Actinomycetota bacterium]|nr:hypothetical protein [Actinomycetota bacterium]